MDREGRRPFPDGNEVDSALEPTALTRILGAADSKERKLTLRSPSITIEL